VLIPPSPSPLGHPRSRANSLRSRSRPRSRSNSVTSPSHPTSNNHSAESSLLASPGRVTPPVQAESHPIQPIPTNILNPIDTQAAQIRHMIAAAHAEKEHVQSQIKEARRASQRAEAALRLEIETVKKATEKAGSLDLRAKQKALALQEQVKQGWAGAENAEKEAGAVEEGLAGQESRLESTTAELESVRQEWKTAKEKEDEVREREKKSRQDEEKKLQEVVGKIDKLRLKREKKELEKAELTKKLEDLVKQAEEIERRNEEERVARVSGGAYWWDPYSQGGHAHGHHGHHHPNHGRGGHGIETHTSRTLTNHPSLNNLSNHGGHGPQRGRGFAGRYPSAGSTRPAPSAPSPTHTTTFHAAQHPAPPTTSSPAFRPPKAAAGIASPAGPARTPSSSGVNVAALPFHPSNPNVGSPSASTNTSTLNLATNSSSASAANSADHHTSLMPPQLQHRIYLPNTRPRPAPNFNPPPSVLAERQSPPLASTPSFPPLPGSTGPSTTGPNTGSKLGPSLASIVTRAVLSPAALAERGMTNVPGGSASTGTTDKASAAAAVSAAILSSGSRLDKDGQPVRSPTYPLSPSNVPSTVSGSAAGSATGGSTPSTAGTSNSVGSRAVTFSPPPVRAGTHDTGFSVSNASGPWSGLGGIGNGMIRTSTPPVTGSAGHGRDSPNSAGSR
jgi:hypothetical protein